MGVATGLAWTEVGGTLLSIETTAVDGKGKLILTGQMGDVMQESAQAALSYIRSRAPFFHIENDIFQKVDIHIHVPEGAIPKDGPSAGITLALALLSTLTNEPIRRDVAMTGEITLRGRVLKIGGLKEKILAAHRAGIQRVIIPEDNLGDLEDIPEHLLKEIEIISVNRMDEVVEIAMHRHQEGTTPLPVKKDGLPAQIGTSLT